MRVVHLGLSHGIEDIRIVKKECRTLSESGYEVFYLTSDRNGKGINKIIDGTKVKTVENTTNSYSLRKNFFKFIQKSKTITSNLYSAAIELNGDVYHIHEGELLSVGKKLKKQGKTVIYDAHEDIPRQRYTYFKEKYNHTIGKINEFVFEKYENTLVRRFDFVITATAHIEERFKKINANTIVVNNYPLLDDIKCENGNFEMRENCICFAGSISNSNGIHNIIKAIKEINGKFLIAGSFSNKDKLEYEKMAGWANTDYLGILGREEINNLYQKCVAGIVTDMPTGNNIEGLPIKMFEFMIAGLPVITSNFPLRKEIVLGNNCGFCVDPINSQEIAEAIRHIFSNKIQVKKMGENGRQAVLLKYNWDIEKKKLLKIYSNIGQIK